VGARGRAGCHPRPGQVGGRAAVPPSIAAGGRAAPASPAAPSPCPAAVESLAAAAAPGAAPARRRPDPCARRRPCARRCVGRAPAVRRPCAGRARFRPDTTAGGT
jgi:hypothetical protein